MTFTFDRGPWAGRSITDEASVRTGDLERFAKRLDRQAHPDVGQACDEELARRAAATAAVVQAEEAKVPRKPPQVPEAASMPMPCGHPVSDLEWVEEGVTACQGCTEETLAAETIRRHIARSGSGVLDEDIYAVIKKLTTSLRKRL